jgi:hypothetical protein
MLADDLLDQAITLKPCPNMHDDVVMSYPKKKTQILENL